MRQMQISELQILRNDEFLLRFLQSLSVCMALVHPPWRSSRVLGVLMKNLAYSLSARHAVAVSWCSLSSHHGPLLQPERGDYMLLLSFCSHLQGKI